VILYTLTPYLVVLSFSNAIRIEYEVYEPKETYYYSTLETKEEKIEYIKKVESHSKNLYRRGLIIKALIPLTFLSATILLILKDKIIESKQA